MTFLLMDPSFWPRRSIIMTRMAGGSYMSCLLGGAPRKIGSVYAQEATWSPDGTHILFADQNALNLVESDGSNPRKLWEALEPQAMVGSARSHQTDAPLGHHRSGKWRS